MVSPGNLFELGFVEIMPERWYLGIWYKQDLQRTCLWVANRDKPLSGDGILKFSDEGNNLILLDQHNNSVHLWSTNLTERSGVMVAQLKDNGNLVVKDSNGSYIWQSFDFPTDTLLPGMKLGETALQSWKNQTDPSPGTYPFEIRDDVGGLFSTYLLNQRIDVWNGNQFGDMPAILQLASDNQFVMTNQSNNYSRLTVDSDGIYKIYTWISDSKKWNLSWSASEEDACYHEACGTSSYCYGNSSCNCIQGFYKKEEWQREDRSNDCLRRKHLNCTGDTFFTLKNMKLPESSIGLSFGGRVQECEAKCRELCKCTAFAVVELQKGHHGCVAWYTDEFKDMRNYTVGGQDLYIKLAANDHDV